MSEHTAVASGDDLSWEIAIPLLANRIVVGGLARVFAITGGVLSVLMAVRLGTQGDWALIVPVSAGFVAACAGLFLVSLAALAALFRDEMRFRFTISAEGVRMEALDRTLKFVNRLALGADALAGSPGSGAGLVSASRETEQALWSGSFRARYDDRAHVIVLRNAWRGLLYVYCTPEVYPLAVARIRDEIESNGTAERVAGRSRLRLGL